MGIHYEDSEYNSTFHWNKSCLENLILDTTHRNLTKFYRASRQFAWAALAAPQT